MPLDERKERWSGMMAHLERKTVANWCGDFLRTLAAQEGCPEPASSNGEVLAPDLANASRRTPLWDAVKN
jgi:trehalose-6-phosphate synthase